MADRNNYGNRQVVTEGELDGSFDRSEEAERNTNMGQGLSQVPAAASPGPAEFGGITAGLTVVDAGAGQQKVNVALGSAWDNLGRRVALDGAATVLVTHSGATTEGDLTDAVGSISIASAVPVGQRIIVSLFIVYDEDQSDQRVDGTGATYYFEEDESFHFDLQIGAAFAHPPAAPLSRAALADGKILLADLLLGNNGVTLDVIAVCTTDAHWDTLGAQYEDLTGRRSDWFAAGEGADFPRNAAEGISYRGGTARTILRQILAGLQRQTSAVGTPAGAAMVGARVGAGVATRFAYSALNLTAGSVQSQLELLLAEVNKKLSRGADSIRPPATYDGLIFDPTDLTGIESLINIKALLGASSNPLYKINRRGHLALPRMFFDDFMYRNQGVGDTWSPGDDSKWGQVAGSVGSLQILYGPVPGNDVLGGVLLISAGGGGNTNTIIAGLNPTSGNASFGWNLGETPFATAVIRFKLVQTADAYFELGFTNDTDDSSVLVVYDAAASANLIGQVSSGAGDIGQGNLLVPADTSWHTVRIMVSDEESAEFQLDGNAPILVQVPLNTFTNGPHQLMLRSRSLAAGAIWLYVDRVIVGESSLISDM